MKKTYIIICLVLISGIAYAQKDFKYFASAHEDPKYYVGKTFRIDTLPKSLVQYGYLDLFNDYNKSTYDHSNVAYFNKETYNSDYKTLVGQTFKCTDVVKSSPYVGYDFLKLENKKLGTVYYQFRPGSYIAEYLICLEEMAEQLRKKQAEKADIQRFDNAVTKTADSLNTIYAGKTLWMNNEEFDTDATDKPGKANFFRFQPVIVQKITGLPNGVYVYRVFAKTSTGTEGFLDLKLISNQDDAEMKKNPLLERFFMKNPVTTYQLTPAKIAQIRKGIVRIGMSKDLVKLTLGKPDKINRTTSGYEVDEQWVYSNSYYYFTNGRLTSFQN